MANSVLNETQFIVENKSMRRTPAAISKSALWLAIVAAVPVWANELPTTKAGLWELTNSDAMTSKQCKRCYCRQADVDW